MDNKIDPVCGMKGSIKAHDHYFCSQDCINKFEKQNHIESTNSHSNSNKIIFYSIIAVLLLGLIALLQITGFMVLFMGVFFIIVSALKFADWKGFANAFAMYILKKNKK